MYFILATACFSRIYKGRSLERERSASLIHVPPRNTSLLFIYYFWGALGGESHLFPLDYFVGGIDRNNDAFGKHY